MGTKNQGMSEKLYQLAESITQQWILQGQADTGEALHLYPELAEFDSIVVNLLSTEYLLKREKGEALDASLFAADYPRHKESVLMRLMLWQLEEEEEAIWMQSQTVKYPAPGAEFCGMKLVAQIGAGQTSRVFLADTAYRQERRPIVVKVSPLGGDEAQVHYALRHENIISVLFIEEEDDSSLVAICMPYLSSSTLQDFLQYSHSAGASLQSFCRVLRRMFDDYPEEEAQRLPGQGHCSNAGMSYVDGVLETGRKLADALAHIHEQGICHRDLKPSNILITQTGDPIILDFNLSTKAGYTSWTGGTVPYMSPEQLANTPWGRHCEAAQVDERSDIFALGIVLYELLTGVHPFGPINADESVEVLGLLLHERHRRGAAPASQLNRIIDHTTSKVIAHCLAFNPEDRYQSATELYAALGECREKWIPRLHRFVHSHSRTVYATVAAVIVASALAAAVIVLRPSSFERHYREGLSAYDLHDYEHAHQEFTFALDQKKDCWEAYLFRALTRLASLRESQAADDFAQCYTLNDSPILLDCQLYSEAKARRFETAIFHGKMLSTQDYESVASRNNLGYAYQQLGNVQLLREASTCFERALEIDPACQIARFNLAKNKLKIAQAKRTTVEDDAITDIEEALRLGVPSPDLYVVAAAIYRQSKLDVSLRETKYSRYFVLAQRLKSSKRPSNSNDFQGDDLLLGKRQFPKNVEPAGVQKEFGNEQDVLIHPLDDAAEIVLHRLK